MKIKNLLSIVAMLAMVFMVSCDPDNTGKGGTKFTLDQTEILATAEGEAVTVNYNITNPVEGGVVLTNCTASWITNLSTASYGSIKFVVAPNYTDNDREAKITVQYTGLEDAVYEIAVKQEASSIPAFTFDVVTAGVSELHLNVTPLDMDTPYICRIYTRENIDVMGLNVDSALISVDMSVIESEASSAGQSFFNYLQNIAYTGEATDVTFSRLIPNTEYVVYCYHINLTSGNPTDGIVYRKNVSTIEPEMMDADFDMTFNIDGAIVNQTITPSDNSINYYIGYWSVADFYSYYGDNAVMEEIIPTKWNESVTFKLQHGTQPYNIIADLCLQGVQEVEYTELKANTDYIFYAFAVDPNTAYAASEIVIEEVRTGDVQYTGMTIDIRVDNIYARTADVYWTASDSEGWFARSVFKKSEFDSWGETDAEKFAYIEENYSFYQAQGYTDMNLVNLEPNTVYVAFAYGLNGATPNTPIFTKEFTTKSNIAGNSNITFSWNEHYNMAALAAADAEHWGDYAAYENYTLLPLQISGVSSSDEVYFMVTTLPIDYYNYDDEWLRDVTRDQYRMNLYSSYNFVAEYERDYCIIAVAKDANGNFGQLYKAEFYLYRSDDSSADSYVYVENK